MTRRGPILPKQPRSASRGRRAFTLIEVLATLVVIGIILPVAMHGISLAVLAAGNARASAEASSLAQAKLSELSATTDFFPGSMSGDFGPDHPEYQWQVQTSSIDLGLEEMTVVVSWAARGQTRSVSVSTWAYRSGTTTGI